MFILGFPTKKQRQPAILFKAYFFDDNGKETDYKELIIHQLDKIKNEVS